MPERMKMYHFYILFSDVYLCENKYRYECPKKDKNSYRYTR